LIRGLRRQELLAYAKAGAHARMTELRRELAALEAAFGRQLPGAKAAVAPQRRRRRTMSAEGRKKISAAAKLRWAKWRAQKKK
jgi:hypothetical protein